LSTHFHYI